ncbi:MAG: T9SS type A sorting domain-containing protein, partial [Sinomicrobium sp.]|nr:T9SS type A sorting domain-containing protein [Sinomicrobium sp.]
GACYARVYLNTVLSAPKNDFVAGLQLYPNPATSFATITLPHSSSVAVKINDVQGRLIYQNQYDSAAAIVLDTRSLTKGLYFVSVAAEGEKTTLKMIVN